MGNRSFYFLAALGVIACAAFWRVPGNQYEWMRTDSVVGSPAAKLPIDQDALVLLAFFAVPVIAVAAINLALAVFRLRGRRRTVSIGFSVALIVAVIARFAISLHSA